MLKILQARHKLYINLKLSDVQAGFKSGRGIRDQIGNNCWIIEKARDPRRTCISASFDYTKAFDCVDHNKLWNILKEMRIPDHLTYLLRNLNAGQQATAGTRHGTTDWFQIGKAVRQGCILLPFLFNLYGKYIMQNGRLDEVQVEIKIARGNINNIIYQKSSS